MKVLRHVRQRQFANRFLCAQHPVRQWVFLVIRLHHLLIQTHEWIVLIHGNLLQNHSALLFKIFFAQSWTKNVGQNLNCRRKMFG